MNNPLERKRETYLTFYEDGITDAILNQKKNPDNKFSAYYKRGFEKGLEIRKIIQEYGIDKIGADNE